MVCGRRIYFVWPSFSLRTAHASAFRVFLLSSAGGVGNRPRWYTPWVHHRCGATNRKVPSTSIMENSRSPFCWQHASPLVRTKVPCNLNSQIHVSQTICPWRSQSTHSAVCTERVLQNRLPTRLVQKAVQAYLNFWLWKVATDMLMRLQMFQCGFLQITCWCLASTQLKEHKPGYVPFCVCQAVYQRVLHLLWLTSTNLFLAAFFHKLLIPLRLSFIAGGTRTFGESCANEDTHLRLWKRTCMMHLDDIPNMLGS